MPLNNIYKIVGINIRAIRMQKGISQSELGFACEFEKSTISRIEAGRTNPTLQTLKKIADALEVTVCELVSENNQ
jgi:transcriptional regulator with XRE-family HTH domain